MQKGMIPRLITAYQDDTYRWEIHRAMMDFFDGADKTEIAEMMENNPDVEGWFNEWLILDFKLENGRTILEDFVQVNPLHLTDDELAAYRDLLHSESGFYEILDVQKKKGLRLRSITSSHEYDVVEQQGTIGVKKGGIMYARVGRVDDHYELVGSNGVYLDFQLGKHLRKQFLQNNDRMTSKDLYELMHVQEGGSDEQRKEFFDPEADIDPARAKETFVELLKQFKMDQFVDVATVQFWMQANEGTSDHSYLTMLVGLMPDDISIEDIQRLTRAVLDLYHITPQDILKGKSPVEMRAKNKKTLSGVVTDQIPMRSYEWIQVASKAHDAMQHGDLAGAVKTFNEAFQVLLDQQTTNTEIYRLFANTAVAYLGQGDLHRGETLLRISLELNPNYDFALRVKEDIESGMYLSNALRRATEAYKDPDHPMNRWNSAKVEAMTTDSIFRQLADWGITETQDTFKQKIGRHGSKDDFVEELFGRYTGSTKDEDFIVHAVLTLAERLCQDGWFVDELESLISQLEDEAFEEEVNEEEVAKLLGRIASYADAAPDAVIDAWKHTFCSSPFNFLHACVVLLYDEYCVSEVLQTALSFERRLDEPAFSVVALMQAVFDDPTQNVEPECARLTELYPLDPHLQMLLAFAWQLDGDKEQEEKWLLEALAILKKREQQGIRQGVPPFHIPLLFAYQRLLENLIEFYEYGNERQVDQYRQELQSLNQREELWEPDAWKRRKEALDERMAQDEAMFRDEDWHKYYQYLKRFCINFATDTLTTSKRVVYTLDGKKFGRNVPCPCGARKEDGSPVKYKKCCGK